MTKIKVTVEGVSPLLMNNPMAMNKNPDDSSRGKKVYIAEDEAKKKLYVNKKGEYYLPNTHFKTSMIKASTDFKMSGKKSYKDYVKSGVFIQQEEIILDQKEYEIFSAFVVINRARVMSWRPIFRKWSCTFTIDIADDFINQATLKQILETAGKYKGVGDYRPEYGRFKIIKWMIN